MYGEADSGGQAEIPPEPLSEPRPEDMTGIELLIAVGIIWGLELMLGIGVGVLIAVSGQRYMAHGLMVTTGVSWAATLGLCWYFVCRRHNKSIAEGFKLHYPGTRAIVWGAAVSLVIAAGGLVLMAHYSTGKGLMDQLVKTPAGLVFVVTLSLLAPFIEEVYYRGTAFPVLKRKLGGAGAIAIVVVWFTAAHVSQLMEDPAGIAVILVISLQYTIQKHIHGSLVPSIVSHFVYNATVISAHFLMQ